VLKFLEEKSNNSLEEYLTWYKDFQFFIKEGLATDQENAE
jgi:HSP90 family molecular chaperone